MPQELRVALIGYGLSGRVFHSPLITATAGMVVSTVVTADEVRASQARADLPVARVVPSAEEIWERPAEHDLVVVATPTASHSALACAAIEAGLPVVVEKPLAPTAAQALEVVRRASERSVLISVFHNRRWDSDHLTLLRLMAEGALGDVMRYESRFERWRPEPNPSAWRETRPPEEGGGVLLDLGAHLVDQALGLFGPAATVYAEVFCRRGGADDDSFVAIEHLSGVRSHLWASSMAGSPGPRLRVLGTRAAFVVHDLDPQEEQLRSGLRPMDPGFGEPRRQSWGRLVRADAGYPQRPTPGRWTEFYSCLAASIREGSPPPVDAGDAVAGLEVLDAARTSAASREIVDLTSL